MTLIGCGILLVVAVIIGVIAEAVIGAKIGPGLVGTVIVGLIGAWIGSALVRIGPVVGGIYVISANLGAIVIVLLLKVITPRRAV